MTHVIRHQYLHIDLNGTETDGLALQRQLSAVCHQWLIPAIERALNRYAPMDGHLVIDRLDIDAGILNLDRLEHDMAVLVEQALEQSLRAQTLPDNPTATQSLAGAVHKTNRQTVYDAFIHFLKTGTLPWSFRLPDGKTLEQMLLEAGQIGAESGPGQTIPAQSFQPLLAMRTVQQRLTRQFSTDFRHWLLAGLAPALSTSLQAIQNRLTDAGIAPDMAGLFIRTMWETAFAQVAVGANLSETQLITETRRSLPEAWPAPKPLQNILEQYWPGSLPAQAEENDSQKHEPGHQHTNTPIHTVQPDGLRQSTDKPTLPEPLNEAEGLYLDNAGLVLLHPFLPQFFGALGITDEDRLQQPERALCLLHFLATGQPVAPEHELILPKLLCNLPLDTPAEADVALTEREQDEANGLLQAVVSHWQALRNTSPDALRGTFLIRPGKLSLSANDDWLLQVEPQPYDILLDQLPWSISMIKLPWMNRLLRVEWR